MNASALILAFLVGTALGVFYFYGLWWTLRRLNSPYAAILLPASFLLRGAVVIAGLYFVMDGLWQALLAALTGFIAARIVIVSQMKKEGAE
jgi:F1F0 ATPase subunit 2